MHMLKKHAVILWIAVTVLVNKWKQFIKSKRERNAKKQANIYTDTYTIYTDTYKLQNMSKIVTFMAKYIIYFF